GELAVRPDEVVQEQVALRLGAGRAAAEVEPALQPEPGATRGRLPAVVRLHPGAPHDDVAALFERVAEQELVVPRLVPAEQQPGAVVALPEHADTAAEP